MSKQKKEHLGIYGVIVNDNNEMLLIKKSRGPYKGRLDLPGGRAEFQETLEETLKREVLEETGLHVISCTQLETIIKIVEDEDAFIRHTAILYAAKVEGDIKTDSDGRDSDGAVWVLCSNLHDYTLSDIAVSASVKYIT